jgi:hypothetical protein
MANIKIKRSAVPSKIPTTGDLALGELAINTYDGKLFTKKDNGTASIIEIGGAGGGDMSGPASSTDNAIARFDGTTGKLVQDSTVIINDSGNVGIGTGGSAPVGKLDIVGSGGSVRVSATGNSIQFTNNGPVSINAGAGTSAVLTFDIFNVIFRNAGSAANYFRINTTGVNISDLNLRAPKFESTSTAYYLDPANTSTSLVVAGNLRIGTTSTTGTSRILAQGIVESTTGGFKFPDGTTQTTAALFNPDIGAGLTLAINTLTHADTSSVSDILPSSRTYITSLIFDEFGHVTGTSVETETVTAITYNVSSTAATGGANLRLSGSNATTDDVRIAAGTNVTVVSTDANTITVNADDQISSHVAAADPHSQYTTVPDVASVTGDVHGVIDRTASSLSFVDGTRTLTVSPTAGSWTFYHKGELKTVSTATSVQLTNTAGARFIKIDPTTLTLVEGTAIPDFINDTILSYVYYDTTGTKALIVGDERHGYHRDTTWHANQHLNVGTIWRSGGALGFTLNNTATIQLDVGTPILIADEDLLHTITHSATPSADFQQILNTAASLEVLYLSGTTYTSTAQSTTPWVAGATRARYNQVIGGVGSLVDADEGEYITYWLIATNDIRRPIKLVMGRASHATVDAAYAEEFQEYGLSFAEQVFMYQIVLQTSTAYANTPKVVVAAVRKVTSKLANIAATATAESHGTLTGREAADSHPIAAITGLETALNGKQATLVSSTNIKTINGNTLLGSGDLVISGGGGSSNSFATINADVGTTTANSPTDTLIVQGGTDIDTNITGDVLTISYVGTGSSGPSTTIGFAIAAQAGLIFF